MQIIPRRMFRTGLLMTNFPRVDPVGNDDANVDGGGGCMYVCYIHTCVYVCYIRAHVRFTSCASPTFSPPHPQLPRPSKDGGGKGKQSVWGHGVGWGGVGWGGVGWGGESVIWSSIVTWLWTQALTPQCDRTPPPRQHGGVTWGARLRDLDTNTWMSSSPQYSSRISVHVGLIIRDNIRGELLEYLGVGLSFWE